MFMKSTRPRRSHLYPAERQCIVRYYADEQYCNLIETDRGAYMSKAISRATDKLMNFYYLGAVAALVIDEETNNVAATIIMRDLRFIYIEINEQLTQARILKRRNEPPAF